MLVLTELDRDRIAEALREDHFFWLDLDDPSAEEITDAGNLLGVHPVALEDTLEFGQRPKVDVYEQMLLLVYYTARLEEDRRPEPIEVHVHLSGGFVFTVHRTSCTALDELHAQLADEPIHDEGYLVYRLLDTLTDAYFPVINGIEHQVDELERQILLRARREQLPVIYRLRQDVREIHRIASAQRDQFLPTAEAIRGLEGLAQGTREYFRDVGDHLTQVSGELQRQTDDLNALTGTYFNANSDRLNAVATRLTIAGTVFVTWTVFAGFFGQNFPFLVRHISGPLNFYGLGLGLPVAFTVIAGIVFWIKRDDLF